MLLRIILLCDLACVPTLRIIELGRDVDIVEQLESRADRNLMLCPVFPIFHQIRLEKLVLFCRNAVREGSRITHGDLLIPTLLANRFLSLERENLRHGHGQARQGQRDRGVTLHLVDIHRSRDRERTVREALGNVDRRTGGIVINIAVIKAVRVIAVVRRGREVDTRREGQVRIGFRILSMCPLDLEILRQAIIRQTLITQFGHQIRGIEIT